MMTIYPQSCRVYCHSCCAPAGAEAVIAVGWVVVAGLWCATIFTPVSDPAYLLSAVIAPLRCSGAFFAETWNGGGVNAAKTKDKRIPICHRE